MNKRIILAAFFFMAAVFSSAAQDVKTEEEKLSSDYYMALYRDKGNCLPTITWLFTGTRIQSGQMP